MLIPLALEPEVRGNRPAETIAGRSEGRREEPSGREAESRDFLLTLPTIILLC